MKRENLDKRICDIEPNATNSQTYREYIDWGYRFLKTGETDKADKADEKDLYKRTSDLDTMTDEELTDVLEELDWLLEK